MWRGVEGLGNGEDNMIYLAILATILFLSSAWWMIRDAKRAYYAESRPGVLSIVVFIVTAEAMGILWMFVWIGSK